MLALFSQIIKLLCRHDICTYVVFRVPCVSTQYSAQACLTGLAGRPQATRPMRREGSIGDDATRESAVSPHPR
jgi:hypothetical protein